MRETAPLPIHNPETEQPSNALTRRSLLGALTAAPPAALAAYHGIEAEAGASEPREPTSYRLTQHVRSYYDAARY